MTATDVLVIDVKRACVRDIMTHREGCTYMRNDTVELINMKFIFIALLVAFIAKAFQYEGRWAVTADFLHATRETYSCMWEIN